MILKQNMIRQIGESFLSSENVPLNSEDIGLPNLTPLLVSTALIVGLRFMIF